MKKISHTKAKWEAEGYVIEGMGRGKLAVTRRYIEREIRAWQELFWKTGLCPLLSKIENKKLRDELLSFCPLVIGNNNAHLRETSRLSRKRAVYPQGMYRSVYVEPIEASLATGRRVTGVANLEMLSQV